MTATVSITSTEAQALVSTQSRGVVTSLEAQVVLTTAAVPRVSSTEMQVLLVGPFSLPPRKRRRTSSITYA